MKDRIGLHRFWNREILNPTQNRYTRFVTQPHSELKSRFTEMQTEWKDAMSKKLKTHYSEVWDD
jgi:hypothetical protein